MTLFPRTLTLLFVLGTITPAAAKPNPKRGRSTVDLPEKISIAIAPAARMGNASEDIVSLFNEGIAEAFTKGLGRGARDWPFEVVADSEEFEQITQENRLGQCLDFLCKIQAGEAQKADKIVLGSVGKLRNEYCFTLRVVVVPIKGMQGDAALDGGMTEFAAYEFYRGKDDAVAGRTKQIASKLVDAIVAEVKNPRRRRL